MKAVKKIFITLFVLAIILGGLSYVDYFIVKTKKSLPKVSIKEVDNEKEMEVYKALFYKVWYCTADGTSFIGDYGDPTPVCPTAYKFTDGYYTNSSGLKIKQRDLLLMVNKNIYTHEMIEIMETDTEVNNGVYVAENYGKTMHKILESKKGTINGSSKEYDLAVFPSFNKNEEKNNFEWVYDEENEEKYYCVSKDEENNELIFSKYVEGYCESEFEPIRLDDKWCKLYQNTTLVYSEELVGSLCKE